MTHVGYCLEGQMHIIMEDGIPEMTIKTGDVFYIAPGHDAYVDVSTKMIFFHPHGMEDFAKRGNK
jgi:uncharacterized cupin superfamily protein